MERRSEITSRAPYVFEVRIKRNGYNGGTITAIGHEAGIFLQSLRQDWTELYPEILGESHLETRKRGFLWFKKEVPVGSLETEEKNPETVIKANPIVITSIARLLTCQGHEVKIVQGRVHEPVEI